MVDTLRADHLNSYGYIKPTSPHLSAFADEAVQFDAAFAQASWTRPSVASLLTSLPPSAHKVMYKPDRLPESVTTLAEAFEEKGYNTGGLVTNYNIAPYFNFAQGFDSYRYLDPEYYFFADEGSSKLSLYNLARVIRERVAPSKDNPAHYYQDAQVTTDAAISWIDTPREDPFFLFLTYMDPHDPYFARPLDGEAYARASNVNPDPEMAKRFIEIYDGEIAYWDEHFGRLVAHLKAKGIYDKAVIVVTSDHGEEFQEHGGWWHGTTLYEEQIHVPLIVKLPAGVGSAGFSRDDLASLMDVPPTLLAAAKIKAPDSWHGRDLFGKVDAPDTIFAEEDHQGNVLRALRGVDFKIIEANEKNPRGLAPVEFYKISDDPDETKNLVTEKVEAVTKWRAALEEAGKGAQVGAVERDQLALDESSRERLKSLGYIEEDEKEEPKKDEAVNEE
jgi:arylsulfatase A-like enzyme